MSPYDGLTVYGPLGIGWAITLAILAVVWRDQRSQRREFIATAEAKDKAQALELERREKAHAEAMDRRDKAFIEHLERAEELASSERVTFRETVVVIAKEFAAANVKIVEMWHTNAREQREALSSALRRIGAREG